MKNIFLLLFLASGYFVQAQDTTFYNEGHKVSTLDSATTYEVKIKDDNNSFRYTEKTYTKKSELIQNVTYNNKNVDGHYIKYWLNGKLRRDDIYENGKFIKGKCYNHQGQDTTYFVMERMPEFPEGAAAMMKYIGKETVYPKKSKEDGVSGKVFVKFVVEKDGSISNVQVLKGVNEELDAEAVRVIQNMPKWLPGVQEGNPVRVYFSVPIIFRMN